MAARTNFAGQERKQPASREPVDQLSTSVVGSDSMGLALLLVGVG